MTVKRIVTPEKFIGAAGEQPTDGATSVRPGATFYDKDTGIMYITYDGTNWVVKPLGVVAKTIQTELLAITKVAANAQQKSSVLALTNMKKVAILIDHGRTATTAFVVSGTEYVIQASQKASGDDTWRAIASVVCDITAASEITADGDEAAGETVIDIGTTNPAKGDVVFWENATLGNSEWMRVVSVTDGGAGSTFTIRDGLTNAQAAAKKIYNKGEHFVLSLDVSAFTRLRVVVNNNAGTTNAVVASRIACITQV